jgi:hypothetical protein
LRFDAPVNLRLLGAMPLDCLFGRGRQAVENSALCSGPNTQFGALPMQLADEVERPRGHRASRRFYPSPGLALLSRFTSHVSPLREPTHTIAFPEFSTALAMTPNIYCQRQPWPTNNSSAFTQCGTHATK